MNVAIEAAGGEDLSLAGDRLGARAEYDVDVRLDVGIARLADGGDAPVLKANVGFHNAPMVKNHDIGDDRVDGPLGAGDLALAHAIANSFAAAELHLLAVGGEILLHLDEQLSVGEPHLVASGGAKHVGIGGALHFHGVTASP